MSGTNGGANMTVTGQTNTIEQQAMVQQIVYNAQNNIPWSLNSLPGDTAGAAIAQSIMNQAQTELGATPTVTNQVAASTTGSNPSAGTDWFSEIGQGMASTGATGAAAQAAAAGASTPGQAAAGGSANAANANLGTTSTTSLSSWLQANLANDGLVILGALLVLGALLISQRQNIQTVAENVAKGAALAG
jgi:hypothetical protein